ncbi:MAG: class I SAM-dependent methyltransferase [Nitriliruptoraceae bacterium]
MSLFKQLVAAVYDPVMGALERGRLGAKRRELLADLSGDIVEIGAGTGANLRHLPPGVGHVTAVEPDPAMAERLRTRAAELGRDVEVVHAPAEALPLPDHSVHVLVTTLVLCSVRDPEVAVAEFRRVLRDDGQLLVLEHVVDPTPVRARLQRRLTPAWRVLTGGCHLDRDTRTTLARGGFDVSEVTTWQLSARGPTVAAVVGIARPR